MHSHLKENGVIDGGAIMCRCIYRNSTSIKWKLCNIILFAEQHRIYRMYSSIIEFDLSWEMCVSRLHTKAVFCYVFLVPILNCPSEIHIKDVCVTSNNTQPIQRFRIAVSVAVDDDDINALAHVHKYNLCCVANMERVKASSLIVMKIICVHCTLKHI